MGETETRTVETVYTAKDAGHSAVVDHISETFKSAAEHAAEMKARIGEFRAEMGMSTLSAVGLGYGIGSWVERAREANREFLNTQQSIAGVLSSSLKFERGAGELDRFNRSMTLSRGITEELEEQAAKLNTPLQDIAQTYRTTAGAAGALGLSQKQVMELTESAAATAKRYGVAGEMSAMRIAQALQTGRVRGFDPFDMALRRSIGNMQHLSAAARFEHIQRALQGSGQIAEQMGDDIEGSINRARQTVDSLFRDATGPLFREVTNDVAQWAKHLHEAKINGKPLIDDIAGKLVTGFHALEATSRFIKEHWISIGAVFAGLKAGNVATSLAGTLSGAGAAAGAFGGPLTGLGGILGMFGKVAPALGGIVSAAGLAAIALHGVYEEWQGRKKQASELGGFFEEIGKIQKTEQYLRKHNAELSPDQIEQGHRYVAAHAQMAAEVLKQKGLYENGSVALEKFNGVMDSMADDVKRDFMQKLPGAFGSSGELGAMAAEVLQRSLAQVPAAAAVAGVNDTNRKFAKAPITNIYGGIHMQMKFEEADPDRIFLRFKSGLESEVANKSQSVEAEPESH